MLNNICKTVVLGGSGQMASLFLPYLPNPIALVDTKNVNADVLTSKRLLIDRLMRRLTSSELNSVKSGKKTGCIGSLCLLSVPNDVYRRAAESPGSSKLSRLLGVSVRGHSRTLFIHQTSVHSLPSEILEPLSGLVLGVHLLHGPAVIDFREETVVITASARKKAHDKYSDGYAVMKYILNRMGYKKIFQMTPGRHDQIMANIQFLTHSMLLVLGDLLTSAGNFKFTPDNYSGLPGTIYILLNRMNKQEPHVYKGIATGNSYNKYVIDAIEDICMSSKRMGKDWLCEVICRFGKVRDHLIHEANMTQREKDEISTPMSRVRDGMIEYAKSHSLEPGESDTNIDACVERYLNALSSEYDQYFCNIMKNVDREVYALKAPGEDFETIVMQKYEAFRR